MGALTQQITVAVTTTGMPLRLIWQGQEYTVAAEPVRWYERRRWWENPARGAGAPGAGVIDHEIWRVQARVRPGAPLKTFDLSHRVGTGQWRLISVHIEHDAELVTRRRTRAPQQRSA